MTLTVARDSRFRQVEERRRLRAVERNDNTVEHTVRGLRSDRTYFYRFTRGGDRSDRGSFTTAPGRNAARKIAFAWTGDSDPVEDPSTGRLHFGRFGVFSRMRREGNDFNVNLGDTIYSDTDSEFDQVDPLALTVDQKREKYRTMLTVDSLRELRADTGMYNRLGRPRVPQRLRGRPDELPDPLGHPARPAAADPDGQRARDLPRGREGLPEYMPVTYSNRRGIYRSVRWGKNLELFFLDERSFRDAGADDGGVCDNPPGSGRRDFAPTAPQRIRSLFARRRAGARLAAAAGVRRAHQRPQPRLPGREPVPRLHARDRALEGDLQGRHERDADPADLRRPLRPLGGLRGRATAAARVPARRGRRTCVFLTADVHANLVNDARLATFPRRAGR